VHQCDCTTLQHWCTSREEEAKIQQTQPCHPWKLGIYRNILEGQTGARKYN
jgi:hypothetical protein